MLVAAVTDDRATAGSGRPTQEARMPRQDDDRLDEPPARTDDPVVRLWASAAWRHLAASRSADECAALTVVCERLRARLEALGVKLPAVAARCGAEGACPGHDGGTAGPECDLPWPAVS